ncbi:ubiquitin-protein ligase E/phosphatidylinositol(3)-phosphate binding protein [Schizosaccharomyces octosporus yFS286]|uniref:Ubiquitin-protein ligase E/phosphatidylinositol(3)-phosphate binding protein n=1 Tax=Schizosaccharomyces octosporus (strain yFS286) TaxID=483514 RepID=S9PYQ0_SCHOY|nr:ubiquitin-protein ligase E/phosphatidylinositol(3)-phosphate binding protein [Schizosaccharomyces octosporus yFS286]EPX72563.1 ubiquitin-protein ligase E/phosphatidylinositol(3)-phosphate binding protein [Schizosaccharomyces octosporus yFS286]
MNENESAYPPALCQLLIDTPAAEWQADEDVVSCTQCGSSFNWFRRKHHCRWCGKVYCANCSNYTSELPSVSVSTDSSNRLMLFDEEFDGVEDDVTNTCQTEPMWCTVRVCENCFHQLSELKTLDIPFPIPTCMDGESSPPVLAYTRFPPPRAEGYPSTDDAHNSDDMVECPVCYIALSKFKSQEEREEHIASCFNRDGSSPPNIKEFLKHARRYISVQITENSPCVGEECIVCFEEFSPGDKVARIEYCLCMFHLKCYRDWLSTGAAGCPVHAATLH